MNANVDDSQSRRVDFPATACNLEKNAEGASVDKRGVREIDRKCLRIEAGLEGCKELPFGGNIEFPVQRKASL